MRKYLAFIVVALLGQLSSCKEDEGPPAKISFSSPTSFVGEGDGKATISLKLDRAPSNDLILNFTLEGSAKLDEDYVSAGFASIPKGSTEANIQIDIIDNDVFEFDPDNTVNFLKKLEITLSGVSGNGLLSEVATELKHTLYIKENEEEPHLIINLSWEDKSIGGPGDVDMDLLFWYEKNPGSNELELAPNQFQQGVSAGLQFETLALSSLNPDTNYGLTFLYFEGTATDLEFTVKFTIVGGTLLNGLTEASYTGTYSLANLNGTAYEDGSFQVEQFYLKSGYNYPTISDLTIPTSGSRTSLPTFITPQLDLLRQLKSK